VLRGSAWWLVAGDGGVFAFDATFHGSAAGHLASGDRVIAIAADKGGGYRLVMAMGLVFNYREYRASPAL